MSKAKFYCGTCKKEFYDYASQRRNLNNVFCSRPCKYEWNKTVPGFWKGKKIPDYARAKMSKNHADVSGDKNPRWKGGRRIDKDGYVLILNKEHPNADYHGYVREHRIIIEKNIGRYLNPEENVHHIDGDKVNNKLDNLKLFSNTSEHLKYHYEEKTGGAGMLRNNKKNTK